MTDTQITRDDLKTMTPPQIEQARHDGKLDQILSGADRLKPRIPSERITQAVDAGTIHELFLDPPTDETSAEGDTE